jgi:hypothetical protein
MSTDRRSLTFAKGLGFKLIEMRGLADRTRLARRRVWAAMGSRIVPQAHPIGYRVRSLRTIFSSFTSLMFFFAPESVITQVYQVRIR